ncbi:MAG: exodeoxyribonuclease VII large subunit [Alphaproteobacteria bacterium]|nr:exodeoxyribonuclease VII large subunit [Alphaproteobacteria bacterium]
MSDLIDDPAPGQNAPEFSVSEISGAVKRMIEGEFDHVRIRGEVGRVSRPASGHLYLDLKDDRAVLAGVIWKGVANRLRTRPEEGMEVVATGKLTTFPGQSRYQMVIEDIAPAGIGALMAMLEKRKKALAAEGLFDQDRKQKLPYLPEVIGVVTSPSGAVIRDILHRLRDRFPRKVLIWPVPVQGEKCAPAVTAAIEGFNALTVGGAMPRPDLLIVARGGGSIEDLWGFNEEAVARAAAASQIPLISAVGHETDTTLIDFAADVRAPTPTAAAELAVPVRSELLGWLASMDERRVRSLSTNLQQRRQRLRDLARALPNPAALVAMQAQRLDVLAGRPPRALTTHTQARRAQLVEKSAGLRPRLLAQGVETRQDRLARVANGFRQAATAQVERLRTRLDGLERLRQTLGYTATLERGYAVVRDSGGVLISDAVTAGKAPGLDIQFQDGHVQVGSAAVATKPVKKKKPIKPEDQGSLF